MKKIWDKFNSGDQVAIYLHQYAAIFNSYNYPPLPKYSVQQQKIDKTKGKITRPIVIIHNYSNLDYCLAVSESSKASYHNVNHEFKTTCGTFLKGEVLLINKTLIKPVETKPNSLKYIFKSYSSLEINSFIKHFSTSSLPAKKRLFAVYDLASKDLNQKENSKSNTFDVNIYKSR